VSKRFEAVVKLNQLEENRGIFKSQSKGNNKIWICGGRQTFGWPNQER